MPFVIIICIIILCWIYFKNLNVDVEPTTNKELFPTTWKQFLMENVIFYASLNETDKKRFENKIQEFLTYCRITGVKTEVKESDKLLVAASAIIPIFGFNNWDHYDIEEVLIYPHRFNEHFELSGDDRSILGMVGNGYMEGKMILSKEALVQGFRNESDKRNTAIHEFVHLMDKADGSIDGIPSILLDKQYIIPWIDLINKKIQEIFKNDSDIHPYGSTNQAEFFSVVSEYFFEQPQLLEKKHPELYALLESIFNQNMSEKNMKRVQNEIGRNEPCPCGSSKKYKKCCGRKKNHKTI